jgi:hypothetical protein
VFESPVKANVEVEKKVTDIIFDPRVFKKHESKELQMWSWSKLRHEKWIILNDCVNNKIQMRKVK